MSKQSEFHNWFYKTNQLSRHPECSIAMSEAFDASMQVCEELKDAEIAALRGFAIWLTGCGYDFTQHQYFLDNRHLLIGDTGESE